MKQPSYKGFAPLSDAVIDAACAGDVDAIDRILRHYDGYINKLCVRKYIDGSGNVHYDSIADQAHSFHRCHDRVTEPAPETEMSLFLPFHVFADPEAAGCTLTNMPAR